MVGMGEIAALAGSLKTAGDMAKAMVGLRDAQVFQSKAIELQGAILGAQSDAMAAMTAHSDLIEKVRTLEAEVARFETWERDKQRYELKEHGDNRVKAYALKDGVEPSEVPHSVCPDCYQQRKISIVQETMKVPGMARILGCHACGWEAYTVGAWRPEYAGKPMYGSR
jgi:hypothetical protein